MGGRITGDSRGSRLRVRALGFVLGVAGLGMLVSASLAQASASGGLEAAKSATVAISDHSAGTSARVWSLLRASC